MNSNGPVTEDTLTIAITMTHYTSRLAPNLCTNRKALTARLIGLETAVNCVSVVIDLSLVLPKPVIRA